MFHHFPESELGLGSLYEETGDYLVRSTDFTYSAGEVENGSSNPVFSFLTTATQNGYKRTAGGYLRRSLPPLQFTYQPAIVDTRVREVPAKASRIFLQVWMDRITSGSIWTEKALRGS